MFSIYVRKHVHLCTACVPCIHGRQKLLDPLELELQIVESYHAPLGSPEEQPILLTVEHLSSPCYISLIKGGVKSEFLNRWFWFYSVQYLWGYFDFGIYQKPAHHIFVMFFLFFLLRSSLCSWTWRSSCLLPPSARIAWVHRHTQPHFSFLFLLVLLRWYFYVT